MEYTSINQLMELLTPLSLEMKMEIVSRLSKQVQTNENSRKKNKQELLNSLVGAWKDTSESLTDDILKARVISDKNIF